MPVPLLLSLGSLWKSPWSACTLMGWLLSLFSAQAAPATARPAASNSRAARLLFGRDIGAHHVVAQHHTVVLHVAVHAHAGRAVLALHHHHVVVGAGDVGVEVDGHFIGVDDQGRA